MRNSRPVAETVGGAGHHQLAKGWNYNEDEDGHQLNKQSKTSLFCEKE